MLISPRESEDGEVEGVASAIDHSVHLLVDVAKNGRDTSALYVAKPCGPSHLRGDLESTLSLMNSENHIVEKGVVVGKFRAELESIGAMGESSPFFCTSWLESGRILIAEEVRHVLPC